MKTTLKAALLVSVLGTVLMAQASVAKDTYNSDNRSRYNANGTYNTDARGNTYNRSVATSQREARGYNHDVNCDRECWKVRNPTYTYGREVYSDRIGGNDDDMNNRNRHIAIYSSGIYNGQHNRVVKH